MSLANNLNKNRSLQIRILAEFGDRKTLQINALPSWPGHWGGQTIEPASIDQTVCPFITQTRAVAVSSESPVRLFCVIIMMNNVCDLIAAPN